MIRGAHIADIALTLTMTVAGLAFGRFYFAALKRGIARFIRGEGWLGPLALTFGRLGAAILFLGIAAKFGAFSLLGAFAGFLMARALALHAERHAS